MQNDMRGIIEEQQISRRQAVKGGRSESVRRKSASSSLSTTAWPSEPWTTSHVEVPALRNIDSFDREKLSTASQHPVRRAPRRRGRWRPSLLLLRSASDEALALPARARVGALAACDLAVAAAIPLAIILLSILLNTVVASRELVARGMGVEIPVLAESALLSDDLVGTSRGSGEPLSIDPSGYEKIRRTNYVVQPGDTISEIAVRFDLEAGTILSMNPIDDVRRLLPGTVLSIPDRDGLFYAVQPGDSLSGIAETYGISLSALADANDIDSPTLQVGDALFVPGASMDEQDYLLAIGELFQWPVRNFYFTSGYGMRIHPITGVWHMHTGIDLANRVGTPILAAGSGRVVHLEDQVTNYGKMIIIDHGNGFKTLYAHLNSFMVSQGEWVTTGEQIGTMGNSGRSTGPHLHFSVINGARMEDPTRHLP
jgi:LysM repeat protein